MKLVEAAKRAVGPLTMTLPAIGTGEAWAIIAVVAILVLMGWCLSRDKSIGEFNSLLYSWRRDANAGANERARPTPDGSEPGSIGE